MRELVLYFYQVVSVDLNQHDSLDSKRAYPMSHFSGHPSLIIIQRVTLPQLRISVFRKKMPMIKTLRRKQSGTPSSYYFQFTKGFLLLKLCSFFPLSFGYKSKHLVPSPTSVLEDSSHTPSSHPLSSHCHCNLVLGHRFAASFQVPTALGRSHVLQLIVGQGMQELFVL